MCIAVFKPIGQELPSEQTLTTCFENNPDGAGFMYTKNKTVHIQKGIMTIKELFVSLESLKKEIDIKSTPMVLHFRISTQGGVRADCTHPYPLSSNMQDLRKIKKSCNIGIAHNGIIDLTSSGKKNLTYNDTMVFVTQYLSLIIDSYNYYKNKNTIELIKKLCNSKLAILDKFGHCELIGDWIKSHGIYYSNNSYLEPEQYCSYMYSYFEDYYNSITQEYEFTENECPRFDYGIADYCEFCSNRYNCI